MKAIETEKAGASRKGNLLTEEEKLADQRLDHFKLKSTSEPSEMEDDTLTLEKSSKP